MKLRAYHLEFSTPLHMGVEGIGQERINTTIHSDTLWGALAQMWSLLFDDSPRELASKCPFLVSSCFPLVGGKRLYPLPARAKEDLAKELATIGEDEAGIRFKQLKKIRYIEESLLERLICGDTIYLEDLQKAQSHFPGLSKNTEGHSVTSQRPRQRIDRLTGGVEGESFFYCTDQYFKPKSGLFFLYESDDTSIREMFEAALRLLGDTGLGADRSIGRGRFTFTSHETNLSHSEDSGKKLLLSLYHPTPSELAEGVLKGASYELVRRGGHAATPAVGNLRRADLWVLGEGATLLQQVKGDIPEVLSESDGARHPVLRYARALTLPIMNREAR